ncbi:MAG TPA: antibiotic biosynthesis monooxygenase [Symbiobacteriaceae bacterium]|nr:antibiotic biosynthesis monooxygenase [Symbiobacteriaceae bacterium]
MYVAMNRITVVEGKGPELEAAFASRAKYVNDAPGFVAFHLLRPQQGNTYISMSMWRGKDDFDAWTKSENFAAGHRSSTQGVVAGRPVLEEYEVAE